MSSQYEDLEKLQTLIIDILRVERNHRIPESERRENVVEHSFSVAMLSWRIFDALHPPLDLNKIFKYALVHDFSERGQKYDVNTYASAPEREAKKKYEDAELEKISSEMVKFTDFVHTLQAYEECKDEEALFVWCVDKLQARVLGSIDKWRPYRLYGVTYEQFCTQSERIIGKCPPYLKDLFASMFKYYESIYYDQPSKS